MKIERSNAMKVHIWQAVKGHNPKAVRPISIFGSRSGYPYLYLRIGRHQLTIERGK
jgi:hypothetical protein